MNSSLIDVALGLSLTFALFSTMCTVITEWWSRIRTQRGTQLKEFLQENLFGGDEKFAERFHGHPLIKGLQVKRWTFFVLGKGKPDFPSYISPSVFALAMIDLSFADDRHHQLRLNAARDAKCLGTPDAENGNQAEKVHTEQRSPSPGASALRVAGETPPDTKEDEKLPVDLYRTLHALTNCTRNSCQHTQERIENWFTDSMARLTGQYTRYAHTVTLVAAMVVTLLFNVDSVRLARELYRNPAKAQAAALLAAKLQPVSSSPDAVDKAMPEFQKIKLPIGWETPDNSQEGWLARVLGWLISIAAFSLGAPFWFDTLNRLSRLRQAGVKPGS